MRSRAARERDQRIAHDVVPVLRALVRRTERHPDAPVGLRAALDGHRALGRSRVERELALPAQHDRARAERRRCPRSGSSRPRSRSRGPRSPTARRRRPAGPRASRGWSARPPRCARPRARDRGSRGSVPRSAARGGSCAPSRSRRRAVARARSRAAPTASAAAARARRSSRSAGRSRRRCDRRCESPPARRALPDRDTPTRATGACHESPAAPNVPSASGSRTSSSVRVAPSRSTSSASAGAPGARSFASRSSQRQIDSPATATTRSPSRSPARSATEPGSTPPMREVIVGTPAIRIAPIRNTGSTRFITGPASAIAMRCHTGRWLNARLSSSGGSGSPGTSPSIFTKPPRGSAATTYSVSPTVRVNSDGPNPIENFSTFTPSHFATAKWPSSWMKISTPSSSTNGITTSKIPGKLTVRAPRSTDVPAGGPVHRRREFPRASGRAGPRRLPGPLRRPRRFP